MFSTDNKDFKTQMTEARREQILLGAAQVFSEKGFHKATTKQIARAAGISEGTIYNYFDNKRDLLLAMLEVIGTQPFKVVVEAHAHDTPKAFLRAVLSERFQLLQQRGQFMAPVLAEVFADVELREAVYQKIVMPLTGYFEQYLHKQIEAGHFRAINPIVVSRALIGAMIFNAILKVSNIDPRYANFSADEMIEEILTIFVDGLLQPEA